MAGSESTIGALLDETGGSIKTGPFGTKLKASEYTATGVPVISVGEVGFGRLRVHHDTPRVDETVSSRMPEFLLKAGDIVFGRKGAVERSAQVQPDEDGYFLGSDGIRIRLNVEECDSKFISYQLQTAAHRSWMIQHAGGTTMPSLNEGIIRRIPIILKPLAEQKAIAAVLGALDDKIEVHRRMNATLEAMARALFQSWFVDFDPVRAKLDGRPPAGLDKNTAALFPAKFQESSLGSIPQGWEALKVVDISARIAMGPFGSRITRDNFVPEGVPVVRGGNLTDGFADDDFVFLTEAKADELKASLARSLDLVFTHRGTLGQVGIIPHQSRYTRYVVSQSQMLLSVDRQKLSPWAAYLFFSSPIGEAALLANTSTTGVPAISRPTTSLKAISIVVPPLAVSQRFDEIVQPLFLQREQNARQSRTLATLRDTLLPKLLSGEIRIG